MSLVLERRRAFWPNPRTRAEAARLYAGGMELREVLERYPNEVISVSGGETARSCAKSDLCPLGATAAARG
jgi:hypothetical protein